MNYFAHGARFIDRPYFLAGTALPDCLAVVDRQVRLRAKRVIPFADDSRTPEAELAAGILQHFHDDDWFHRTPAFAIVSAELTSQFRAVLNTDEGHRPAFLGHIVTELLLDGVLIEREPALLEAYYTAFSRADAARIERAVNAMVRHPTNRLAVFLRLFERERFLADYSRNDRLLFRLNQIMRRVKLLPLPSEVVATLDSARRIVEQHAGGLLTALTEAT